MTLKLQQPPICHGHLSSHNVMVADWVSEKIVKVKLADTENSALMKRDNMFYNYKVSSVWSSPEILKSDKKLLDAVPQHDVYSYSMILW